MERKEFYQLSARALEYVDDRLGELEHEDLDIEYAGDVMSLRFTDKAKFVINAHGAAQQIWMAAGTTAWHFDYDGATETWIARRTGDELMSTLARVVGDKLDIEICL
jgi:CyaY protein